MKELTNNDIYTFISKELSFHPKMPQYTPEELMEKKDEKNLWEDLIEQLDCLTICEVCGKPMIEGYIMNGSHYCSDVCLYEDYSKEQVKELCSDNNDECYYTNWYENSITYNTKQ